MKSLKVLWYQISIACIKIFLVLLLFLFIKQDYPAILGLLLGTAASLVQLYFHAASIKKSVKMSSTRKSSSYAYSRYAMRQVFVVLVLIVSMSIDFINFFWTVGGLLLPKLVIIGSQLFPILKKGVLRIARKGG